VRFSPRPLWRWRPACSGPEPWRAVELVIPVIPPSPASRSTATARATWTLGSDRCAECSSTRTSRRGRASSAPIAAFGILPSRDSNAVAASWSQGPSIRKDGAFPGRRPRRKGSGRGCALRSESRASARAWVMTAGLGGSC
jgi:hypothetical protein